MGDWSNHKLRGNYHSERDTVQAVNGLLQTCTEESIGVRE